MPQIQLTRIFELAMKRLNTRLDDQNIQINSMCGQLQVQGERLHKIEVIFGDMEVKDKDDVTSAMTTVKEEINAHKCSVQEIARSNNQLAKF